MNNSQTGTIVIFFISLISVLVVLSLDPIKQNTEYHNFIDQRTYFGIPNFWNVISNLPFLLVGMLGLFSIIYSNRVQFVTNLKIAYIIFFLSVSMVAVGSSYYHFFPSNDSLIWDRLPMTISFMSLFSIVISEFTSPRLGKALLWPLIIFGVYSVFYWHSTEDLRPYILVQFLPLIVIPLILLFFKPAFTKTNGYWFLLFAYALAKFLEDFDSQFYSILIFISGHSIKHVIAALGVYLLLISYNNREQA
ncbi:MAG: ceramidase [Candidatus Polarisedimenticolaceae bacterium]|nr:ceramidase [Candidatus Polarisedimenticolaceae bacterium]